MRALRLPILSASIALTGGCITFHTIDDGIARARLGETIRRDTLTIAPQRLVEDSRCPPDTPCQHPGTVRVMVLIDGQTIELALGRSAPWPGGTLTLVEADPPPRAGVIRYPDEYRFGFRWIPGPSARP